jgi:hypothetical protein
MAILKEKVNHLSGAITNYHKISSVTIQSDSMYFVVDSYASRAYREEGRAIESRTHYFDCTIEEEESMGARQLAYTKLKTLDDYAGAEDC